MKSCHPQTAANSANGEYRARESGDQNNELIAKPRGGAHPPEPCAYARIAARWLKVATPVPINTRGLRNGLRRYKGPTELDECATSRRVRLVGGQQHLLHGLANLRLHIRGD